MFTGAYSILQGIDPTSFTVVDESVGDDSSITGRQIRLIKYDGSQLLPSSQIIAIAEVRATAQIQILSLGSTLGLNIQVVVDDPELGSTIIATYSKQTGDTTVTILAASIANAINTGGSDYDATSTNDTITITARAGLGSTINGGSRLSTTGTTAAETKAHVFIGGVPYGSNTTGTVYTTVVNEPTGDVTIDTYTQLVGDTTAAILRNSIVAHINAGTSGYTATPSGTQELNIIAKTGLGATINTHTGTITGGASSVSGNFVGGANATSPAPVAITQFFGGENAGTQAITSLTYINWPLSDGSTKLLASILNKDYALVIQVNWLIASPVDGDTYVVSRTYLFKGIAESFDYGLTQEMAAKPNIINDTVFFGNKSNLRLYLNNAKYAIELASDQANAQYNLDKATQMVTNQNIYF